MNCRLAVPLLSAYIDGELPAPEKRQLVDHLNDCAACAQQVADLKTLQTALGSEEMYHQAPGTLRSRVAQTLAAGPSASMFTQPMTMKSAAAVLLSIALLAGAAGAGWWWMNQPEPSLVELTLSSHARAIACHRQTELTSSDSQAVKHWLQEKTGQTVQVKDLSAQKFTLVGARVESSSQGVIPVLVYSAGDKTVSVYHWPIRCGQQSQACSHDANYHISNWQDTTMIYWAISDLSAERLEEFAKLMKGGK